MGKLFTKIGEKHVDKEFRLVASLSVEGVNLDTKVLCVPGVLKGIEVRDGMLKFYISKGFSLIQQDQSCFTKLKEQIFVKPVQQHPVTVSKVVPGTTTRSFWFTEERILLKRLMKQVV